MEWSWKSLAVRWGRLAFASKIATGSDWCEPGVGTLRPASRIQPASLFCPARMIGNMFSSHQAHRHRFLWWSALIGNVLLTRQNYDWAILFHSHTPKTSELRIFGREKLQIEADFNTGAVETFSRLSALKLQSIIQSASHLKSKRFMNAAGSLGLDKLLTQISACTKEWRSWRRWNSFEFEHEKCLFSAADFYNLIFAHRFIETKWSPLSESLIFQMWRRFFRARNVEK